MGKISLRAYNSEIEKLIDTNQYQEAIAHCKYILKLFPKHIDTYRLLGKTFLEDQKYSEAADILQRVLSVEPEDFIAQIGMSIIREDEENLDAAIWHMERAFELQPSNAAVQDELRRLYGRRDGVEPPKVRLTRGALVRMYARGDLIPQAIAEAKAAIEEDAQRVDLQVVLARLYHESNQTNKAIRVCNNLIEKLPYCLEANRILAITLTSISKVDEAETYQQKLFALDPYAAHTSSNAPRSSQVPENAITLDRLEWQPSDDDSDQPEWAKEIGVQIDSPESNMPDWMTSDQEESAHTSNDNLSERNDSAKENKRMPENEEELQPTEDSSYVPDWMKENGWSQEISEQEHEGNIEEILTPRTHDTEDEIQAKLPEKKTSEQDEDILSPEDIPDWLKEIDTPPDPVPENIDGPPDQPQMDDEDELKQENTSQVFKSPEIENLDKSDIAENEGDLPAWLHDIEYTEKHDLSFLDAKSVQENQTEEIQANGDAESLQDKKTVPLDEVDNSQITEKDLDKIDTFEDVENLKFNSERESFSLEELEQMVPAELKEEQEIPDEKSSGEIENQENMETLQKDEKEEDPSFSVSSILSQAVGSKDNLPDWLKDIDFDEEDIQETDSSEEDHKLEEETEDNIKTTPVEEKTDFPTAENEEGFDDAFSWLKSLAARQGADEDTLITKQDGQTAEPPTWIKDEVEENVNLQKENILTDISETTPKTEGTREREAHQEDATPDEIELNLGQKDIAEQEQDQKGEVHQWLKSLEEDDVLEESENMVSKTDGPNQSFPEIENVSKTESFSEWISSIEKDEEDEKEDIRTDPKLPSWLQGEKPSDKIDIPDLDDFLDKATGAENEVLQEQIHQSKVDAKPEEIPASTFIEEKKNDVSFGMPEKIGKEEDELENAFNEITQGELEKAIKTFQKTIKSGKKINDVIDYLTQSLTTHPNDIQLWQTLGDAYTKADRLQDALNSYTKAEDLLET